MDRCAILDCTLRDGGYVTNWHFGENAIQHIISALTDAGIDYIECGYINPAEKEKGKAVFAGIELIGQYLPGKKNGNFYLAMADCAQILPEQITPYTGKSIDGIRVVFYKHQIREALRLCESVKKNGYKLFIQPMVTIDYSLDEYGQLVEKINNLHPYAVSIVDSFGYMNKQDFRNYFKLLDEKMQKDVIIGFHSHNNMQLAFITAQDVLEYDTKRKIILDSSLYGMGRGAGNLNTELITNYYNRLYGNKYDIKKIIEIISSEIMLIAKNHTWGYSPYLFLTALYHCHPNFACYLLENHDMSVEEFGEFVQFIPKEMYTKCKRSYVEELYQKYLTKLTRRKEEDNYVE